MKKKKIIIILIIFFIILGSGIFAAYQTGFLGNHIFKQIPVLSNFITNHPQESQETGETKNMPVSPIEEENEILRKENKDLESKVTELEEEKTELLEQVTQLQTELTKIEAELREQKKAVLNAQELADMYQEMKPAAVVKIMDNLDDQTVITILSLLDKKQSAEVIALMDPFRAALITQLLLEKEVQQ